MAAAEILFPKNSRRAVKSDLEDPCWGYLSKLAFDWQSGLTPGLTLWSGQWHGLYKISTVRMWGRERFHGGPRLLYPRKGDRTGME